MRRRSDAIGIKSVAPDCYIGGQEYASCCGTIRRPAGGIARCQLPAKKEAGHLSYDKPLVFNMLRLLQGKNRIVRKQ